MAGVKRTLRASTLVETLVMLLVAGIVFLAATEGLTLLARLTTRRAAALVEAGRQREGCARIGLLLAEADSVAAEGGRLQIYRAGAPAALALLDSMLLYDAGLFRDTLLYGVERLRVASHASAADTLEIGTGGRTLKFPLRASARERYAEAIDRIENQYGYETDP